MSFAVMIEPFLDGVEYIHELDKNSKHSWSKDNPIKVFDNREDAEKEASKWNTGVVVEYPVSAPPSSQYSY